jgi:hypothetical protein
MTMAKRLMILVGMMTALLVAVAPALAQEESAQEDSADAPPDPAPDTSATLSFELTVKGDPPEGTTFLGFIPAEGGISVPLADPEGDGIFTGSTTLDRFGPGPRPVPPGTEPVSLPVQIVQENGGNTETIRDFGEIALDGDKAFRAKVSFKKERGDATPPEDAAPDSSTSNPGDTEDATNKPSSPEAGEDINQDGLVNETDGQVAATVSDAALESAKSSTQPTLPATGGPMYLALLAPGLTGLILAIGGLLARRTIR